MNFNIKEEKKRIRTKYQDVRKNLSKEQKTLLDENINLMMLSLREYENEKRIFAYVGKNSEISTEYFIKKAIKDGKEVYVPACSDKVGEMDFYRVYDFSDLKIGAFGILEPDRNTAEMLTDHSEGVCFAPGFCFDRKGYRIGYGKGYYDRFLMNFKGVKVGVVYSGEIEEKLPHGRYDVNVDAIITERFIMRIK